MSNLEKLTLETYDFNFLPKAFRETKEEHYIETFGEHYKKIYECSHNFNSKEKTFFLTQDDELAARCVAEFNKYDVRIRDFTVLKKFRGRSIAKKFMDLIEEQALNHHLVLLENKEKSYDLMFLRTYIYLDGQVSDHRFEMGGFLKKLGFKAYTYNPKTLGLEEQKALDTFTKLNTEYQKMLKVFKKELRSNLVLKPEIKEELLRLDERQKEIILSGLDVKLDVYHKRGFVSYKYSVCPVCNDMKSALEDNSSCGKCYINKTCLEPFREGFKEDSQISYKYFSTVREFLKGMKKSLNPGAI